MVKLNAGYGEKIITPPLGIDLLGYGFYLDRKGESVRDDLKVRIIFINNGINSVILISCDLLGFTIEFSDRVRNEIAKETNLPLKNILLACTHTHSGPASQPLLGLGDIDSGYISILSGVIKEAVNKASADRKPAEFSYKTEVSEPIGYNRRNNNFCPIDPYLKVAVFKRADRKIYILSYACHAVTIGRTKEISADWPGALVKEVEKHGNKAVVFQGFSGDIDPVCNMNRWGKGVQEDLDLYANILYSRALKAEKYSEPVKSAEIKACERRVKFPLVVPDKKKIEAEYRFWKKEYKNSPAHLKFIDEWKKNADKSREYFKKKPYMSGVPINGISIAGMKILGLPGEIFCGYGLKLQEKYKQLFTFGHANGNVGYIPTKNAYKKSNDYACYLSPKLYHVFCFSPEIEKIILAESIKTLVEIS